MDRPDKTIPANPEAEEAVLGSLLIDPDAVIKVSSFLRADDFYRERNGWIYQAVLDLHEKRQPADYLTVVDDLERQDRLQQVGGATYITSLINNVPSAVYVEHYARIVERNATLRRLIGAASQIAAIAQEDSEDVDDIVDRAEQLVFGVSERRVQRDLTPINKIMGSVIDRIDYLHRHKGEVLGVPSGFSELDRILGGFQKSDLVVLAARPGVGKTSLALNFALNAAKRFGQKVAFFSLEMSAEQLVQRLLASETGINQQRLRVGDIPDADWPMLIEAAAVLSESMLFIDDTPAVSVMELRTKTRRLQAEYGLDMIVVDYLQLMRGDQRTENRVQEISYITRSLKSLAREVEAPLIALSQLSRAVESRSDRKPILSDLRESGCLSGDTLVTLADTGARVPIRELVGRQNFTVWAFDEATLKLQASPVSRAFCTGIKPVYRLETGLGRSIRATTNHRFRTLSGWKRLDQLLPGDRLALPRNLPSSSAATMLPAEVALLGHLIGDGCTLPRHAIQYTTHELEIAEEVTSLAIQVFGDQVRPRIKPEHSWFQVYLPASEQLTHHRRNPVARWLDALGIFGLRSHEKRLPTLLFEQPAETIAMFLRHLWCTDGCVKAPHGTTRHPTIYFASSSRQLAVDVQALLLRLNINAVLRPYDQGSKGRCQYHVMVMGQEDILRFVHTIGAVGETRNSIMEEIGQWFNGRGANTNRDVIPYEVWREQIVPAMAEAGVTTRQLQSSLGMAYMGTGLYQQNISRERMDRVARSLPDAPQLRALAASDIYWDKIISISPDGEEEVFDLTVPGLSNFIANDIIVHNSIEQDADVVMFIYRDERDESEERKDIAEIIVAKHRNGPTDTAHLFFRKELTRFDDLERFRRPLE